MDENRLQEIELKKNIRGRIIRLLVNSQNGTLMVRQIAYSLMANSTILSPDIGKHLSYLEEAGYIAFVDRKVTAYTAFEKEAVIRLTKKGEDLADYIITDDGVRV